MTFKNPFKPLKTLARGLLYPRATRLLRDESFALASLGRLHPKIDGKSVALIGNATALLTSGAGPAIDSHDCVVRFNYGFVKTPQNQGSRTDLVVASGSIKPNLLAAGFQGVQLIWVTGRRYRMRSGFLRRIDELAIVPIDRARTLGEQLGGALPSSGLVMIWTIRTLFSPASITLYGFDWKRTPSHYTHLMGPHDWAAEAALVARWEEEDSRLTIVDPSAPSSPVATR